MRTSPPLLRGIRVTDGNSHELQSFALFADQADGGTIPIDFDIIT